MKSRQIFTIAFVVIVLTDILADLYHYHALVYISKPLILISILVYTNLTTDERMAPARNAFLTGLWFALLGDIFLMINGQDLFIPGLASFLIMQIFYTYSFGKDCIFTSLRQGRTLLSLLSFLAFAVALYLILQPHLVGILKIAVGIYAVCIATMSWMSYLRMNSVSRQSFLLVFIGALLFMLSDSLIAIDRFLKPIPLNTVWVMSTYAAAQYLIIIGFLKTK